MSEFELGDVLLSWYCCVSRVMMMSLLFPCLCCDINKEARATIGQVIHILHLSLTCSGATIFWRIMMIVMMMSMAVYRCRVGGGGAPFQDGLFHLSLHRLHKELLCGSICLLLILLAVSR